MKGFARYLVLKQRHKVTNVDVRQSCSYYVCPELPRKGVSVMQI